MKKVIVQGKEYTFVKDYPNFTLYRDEKGFKTCFDDYDLGLIEKRHIESEAYKR